MRASSIRLEALRILANGGILNGDSNYVLVEVFPLQKEAEAKALFLEINSAQPVKLIDLPGQTDRQHRSHWQASRLPMCLSSSSSVHHLALCC